MKYDLYTDEQLVNGLINNNKKIIEYFFCKKCSKLFTYIVYSIYGGRASLNELVNEFYVYIAADNWRKVRQFDFRSKLMTWIGVVAVRFFQKKKEVLIEHESSEALIEKTKYFSGSYNMTVDKTFDVRQAIKQISNIRYKMVIEQLDLEDVAPERLASKMGVTVDNLYNIHRRALLQLRLIGQESTYKKCLREE
ncbi:RNA polymerase sigma factor [Prevotella sp.]|uniref:RNA polymerase sigma factor n=1 Tax=Prevotella sp. TaxID=59823 RepID=UPI003F7E0CEB